MTREPAAVPGERWYRRLLRCYPAEFRARYGEEMVAFHRDRWREAHAQGRAGPAMWARTIADVAASAPLEHLHAARVRRRERLVRHAYDQPGEGLMLSTVGLDLRYALRGLRQRPGFALVVVLTLALGIDANAAIFSVVNGILLRPLPFVAPAQLVQLRHEEPLYSVSEPEFFDYRRDATAFSHLAGWAPTEVSLTGVDEPERVPALRVTDDYFEALGIAPAIGRAFTADENAPSTVPSPVIIVSDAFWRTHLGADPRVVGKTVSINNVPRTVIGVLPPRLGYPDATAAIVLPLRLNEKNPWTRNNHYLTLVGRIAPGVTREAAVAQVASLTRRWPAAFPETYSATRVRPAVVPIRDVLFGETRPYLLALLGAVGFVLLIACVNVANLLLARGETRRKELAIRTALGASGRRLARQALTESVLLAVAGGALGLLVAWVGARALVAMAPDSVPRLDEVAIDGCVLAFTAFIALLTAFLFGMVPARRAARGQSAESLRQGGRAQSGAGGTHATRRALVVAEVALAVVMLAGAGLLLRSLRSLQSMDIGFDPSRVLSVRVSLPVQQYDAARSADYYRTLVDRARALPGVRAAAAVARVPMESTGDNGWSIAVDGRMPATIGESETATPAQVTPGYFRTMGIALLKGRDFTGADRIDAPMVAIVNETMAQKLWPGKDPIGHTIRMYNETSPWATVVGVVKDVRSNGFLADVPMTMYFPHEQTEKSAYGVPRTMALVVRTSGDPLALAGQVRELARSMDRAVPVASPRTMDDVVRGMIAARRFATALLGAFATLALALAGIGIYGVIAFAVSQRTYELGLRMALGAQRAAVLRLVVSEALGMTLVGLLLGLVGALAVGRVARSLLVGVGAADVPTFAAVSVVLAGVAVVASALPARRATLVSPTEALRAG